MINNDQNPDTDSLDRRRFAKEIFENIQKHFESSNESLVIGIHGPWGSGKSTLLDFIKDEIYVSKEFKYTQYKLRQNYKNRSIDRIVSFLVKEPLPKKLYVVEFNPWMFSGKEQLHWKFINEFALKIQSPKHKLRKSIESLAKAMNWISESGRWGAMAKSGLSKFSEISIDTLKEETNQLLVKSKIFTIVILDDVDRLAPKEILEMFQLIKLNANFKNTLFIVAFDKAAIAEPIRNEFYLDLDKYLEKIIQVDYSLPSILSEDMESMFFSRLNDFLNYERIKFEVNSLNSPWLIYGLRQYFRNIRDIHRYFNAINFRLPPIYQEINLHDFLIIEAIRLFDFVAYETIKNNFKEARQFGNHTHYQQALNDIKSATTKELYRYLFEVSMREARTKLSDYRIFNTEHFDRYFSLSISKKDMREEEFKSFIFYAPHMKLSLLNEVISNGKIDFLLRRLGTKTSEYNGRDLIDAISPLLTVWSEYHNEFIKHRELVWNAIKAIINSCDDKNYGYRQLLDEISAGPSSNFSPARFYFLWFVLKNLDHSETDLDVDLQENLNLLKSKEDILERTLRSWMLNYKNLLIRSTAFSDFYTTIMLLCLAKYSPDEYEKEFSLLISDDWIFLLLNNFVFRDYRTKTPFGIDEACVVKLLPDNLKPKLLDRLQRINTSIYSDQDERTIKGILEYLRNGEDPFRGRVKV